MVLNVAVEGYEFAFDRPELVEVFGEEEPPGDPDIHNEDDERKEAGRQA